MVGFWTMLHSFPGSQMSLVYHFDSLSDWMKGNESETGWRMKDERSNTLWLMVKKKKSYLCETYWMRNWLISKINVHKST